MEGSAKPPPAGWYVDPDDGALQRFWDGSRWTNSRMPRNEGIPLETEVIDEPPPETGFASDRPQTPDAAPAAETGLPPAAWYADPENPAGMRYWDGARWTEHRTDYLPAPPKKPVSEGMVAAGYITAVLIPIVGVVIGVILVGRDNRHGKWVLAIAVLLMLTFFVIGNAGDLEDQTR
jgi:hypothetical protein